MCVGPDRMHPKATWRDHFKDIFYHFLNGCDVQGTFLMTWWLEKSIHHAHLEEEQEEGAGKLQVGQPQLRANNLETISKCIKEKKVIIISQHGLTKGYLYLTDLTAFYGEMSVSVNEGRATDVISLDFSKALDTVLQDIPLVIQGLDR